MGFTKNTFNKGLESLINMAKTQSKQGKKGTPYYKTAASAGYTADDLIGISIEYTKEYKQWYIAVSFQNKNEKRDTPHKGVELRRFRHNITVAKVPTWRLFQDYFTEELDEDMFGEELDVTAPNPEVPVKTTTETIPKETEDI